MDTNYSKDLTIKAAPAAVYAALTTTEGCSAWWAPATGSAADGGELRFTFGDPTAPLVLRVAADGLATQVDWHVTACQLVPDWVGTTVTFVLVPGEDGTTDLRFRHVGLTPRLECFDSCRAGWEQFLPSLRDYAESGTGSPIRAAG